jgi:hypothetical protein
VTEGFGGLPWSVNRKTDKTRTVSLGDLGVMAVEESRFDVGSALPVAFG